MDGNTRYESEITAGPGGVMTDEVGVVTGDLTVATTVTGEQAETRVQYTGAEEWYILIGSPIPLAGRSGRQVHEAILRAAEQGLPEGLTADHLS
ncbi:hypothetical protein [Streptosporangium roseum]|uniref:hypothetical protein n=1 Tax=Streptosporangium roseum TaxID=2001 RepID=UPI003332D993